MLVALTGASGFVGSCIAEALHRAEHRVRALVRPQSRRDHIAPFVAEWCEGDQSDPQSQATLVQRVDAVIHNAYDWAALQRSPRDNFAVNVLASLDLLESARLAGVRQFLFVSSVSVYHGLQKDLPLHERDAPSPGTLYGAAKAAFEAQLFAYHYGYGMNVSAWRPAAVYGIPPDLRQAQWGQLIRAARDGAVIDSTEGGPITHVRDVADALTLALGDDAVAGQIYNLIDRFIYWDQAPAIAQELIGSSTPAGAQLNPDLQSLFDNRKAIEFFERHGNYTALRRGIAGVREYVRELLSLL